LSQNLQFQDNNNENVQKYKMHTTKNYQDFLKEQIKSQKDKMNEEKVLYSSLNTQT